LPALLVRQAERLPARQVDGDGLVLLLHLHGADVVVADQELLITVGVFQQYEAHGNLSRWGRRSALPAFTVTANFLSCKSNASPAHLASCPGPWGRAATGATQGFHPRAWIPLTRPCRRGPGGLPAPGRGARPSGRAAASPADRRTSGSR